MCMYCLYCMLCRATVNMTWSICYSFMINMWAMWRPWPQMSVVFEALGAFFTLPSKKTQNIVSEVSACKEFVPQRVKQTDISDTSLLHVWTIYSVNSSQNSRSLDIKPVTFWLVASWKRKEYKQWTNRSQKISVFLSSAIPLAISSHSS